MMVLMHTFTIYDSDFCDLVPHIVFNDLDINCIIIKEHRDKIFSPQAAGPNHNGKMVLLHTFGYHCDALAQETFNKYWRPGCAHLESYLSAAISPTSRHTEQCDDESQDFIKILQIHRKENPRDLIVGSLNINNLRYEFQTARCIMQTNSWIKWHYVKLNWIKVFLVVNVYI